MFKYFPHTDADLQTMFRKVGIKSLDDLYAEVPEQIRFRGEYQLPEEMSEIEVRQLFDKVGAQNKPLTCFAGAGVYDHYTPSAIPQLLSGRTDRYGYQQRLDVRRYNRNGRGCDDGCGCG